MNKIIDTHTKTIYGQTPESTAMVASLNWVMVITAVDGKCRDGLQTKL